VASQTVLWTPLPNRYTADGGSLRLSLLASPRLVPDGAPGTLDAFPDFLDWPASVSASTFTVTLGASGVTLSGEEISGAVALPDSATWRALFPPATIVFPFAFRDLSSNAVVSYDAVAMDDLARSLYGGLARSAEGRLPAVSELLDDLGWGELVDAVAANDRSFANHDTGLRDPVRGFDLARQEQGMRGDVSAGLAVTLARFVTFHTPPSTPRTVERARTDDERITTRTLEYERTELPAATDFAERIDFHQIVSAANQYPTLLRRLGLVVDFVLDPATFSPAADALLAVSVEWPEIDGAVAPAPAASPQVRATLSASQFEALPRVAPEPGDFRASEGLLDLDPERFRLVQTDVDGAGLKLIGFARSLARARPPEQRVDPTTRFEREVGAPALRSAGLMLVHRRRGVMLEGTLERNRDRNAAIEAGTPLELAAEDVVRGYRIDVWDAETGLWRSLCRRAAAYDLGGGEVAFTVPDEEGTVRLAATKSADPASNQDLVYLHETLTAWTGWGLCAPMPGRAIDRSDAPADAEAEVPPGIRLRTTYEPVPGSLPRLRYGRRYWIRARLVDLAGNSLDPQADDFGPERPDAHATPYLRHDPVQAPAIALVRPAGATPETPAEGESMERLAIRSFNVSPADNAVPSAQRARRYAVPARTTVKEAELHGMLDSGGRVEAGSFALLKARDKPLKAFQVTATGPLAGAAAGEKTTYAVLGEEAALPYLPDPLATEVGARIFGLPGWDESKVIRVALYRGGGSWPDALSFQIQILEEAGAPRFDEGAGALVVPLPKGARATLRLSVRPSAEALRLLAVWSWLTDADRASLERLAREGQHWMLTPWRTVELVHAVQKPLIAPDLKLQLDRFYGETFASPHFTARVSLATTDRVDLRAEWNEPLDDPAAPLGQNRPKTDEAFSVKITEARFYASALDDPAHTGVPDHEVVGADLIRAGGRFHDLVQPKYHELGDTRYRRIEYWLEATTSFREYMPASVLTTKVDGEPVPTDENIKVVGERVRTWVPSSAPPPAPEVLYTIPTFGWVRSVSAGKRSSWRRGAGLRVYLGRPWNVSGYGEMLAVVLPEASFAGDPNTEPAEAPMKSSVTQWGNDPIWASPFVRGVAPRRADFPLARTEADPSGAWLPPFAPPAEADQRPGSFRVAGLPHPGLRPSASVGLVEIAPHDVFYDEERELWYCDVEVDPGRSYFPFVRLALARYQPDSTERAHLSNIVLADFMSLAPDRWLTVTRGSDPRVRRIAAFGPTYEDSGAHDEAIHSPAMSLRLADGTFVSRIPAIVSPTSVVEVWVERLDPSLGEDFGWKREAGALVERADRLSAGPTKNRLRVAAEKKRARRLLEGGRFEELVRSGLVSRVRVTPTLWEGAVTLPEPPGPGTRFRLVVAEYEEYLVDDAAPYDRVPTAMDRRLVFVEHVELD